ncbi:MULTISPECIES: hypothetical protein [Pseudomonas]|uniref:hypothetical protein n=1 Tax=Pseudomonas TaxID=286 RepID=UPI000BA47C6A|nr:MULTISPECIES: hypothetical protein [Pseudomonas]
MSKSFDMTLFLIGVLCGSKSTQQRHLRQAQIMQAAIQERWQRNTPWTWQRKHMRWFLTHFLKDHSSASQYYYKLTVLLISKRLGTARLLTDRSNGKRSCRRRP